MKKALSLILSLAMVLSLFSGLQLTVTAEDAVESGDWSYVLEDGTARITKYSGSETEIEIPSSVDGYTVTAVGGTSGTTAVSTTVTSVVFPDTVTSITYSAFYKDTKLKTVTFSENLVSIGKYAFYNCTQLTDVTLPSTLTTIEDYAFYSCKAFTTIEIPDSVTAIGTYAFGSCTSATSAVVGNGVLTLGDYAFAASTKLASVTLGSSVQEIGRYAFYNCSVLTSIEIPASVETISEYAFSGAKKLATVTLNEGLKTIEAFAFYNCQALKSITIPSTVETVTSDSFNKCTALATLTVTEDNPYYTAIDNVLYTEDMTTLVLCPEGLEGEVDVQDGVVEIASKAFYYCEYVTAITLPETLTTIGASAFQYCDLMTSIIIPISVTSIGKYAFESAYEMTAIYILNPDCEIYDQRYTFEDSTVIYGYEGSTAESYADSYSRDFVPLEDVVAEEATCTENGSKSVYATDTGSLVAENVTIFATGHQYDKGVVTDPTCTEEGYTTYTCTVCGYSYTADETPANGHNNDIVSAKIETQGCVTITTYEMVCLDCGTESTETITSGEHDYDEGVYTAATCVDNAYTTYTCTVCGQEKHSVVLNSATGVHTGEWKIVDNTPDKICTVCGETYVDLDFTDISAKNVYGEYYDYVAYTSYYNSFIRGVNSTTLEPKRSLTRSEIVTILYRMAGSPYDDGANPYTDETNPFSDVKTTAYYFNAACWALDNGITTETKFKGTKAVSRQETATFLYRYACEFTTADVSVDDVSLDSYPDADEIKSWAEDAMKWANKNEMITGTQQGYLEPTESTLRIHATKIVYGFGVACEIGNFE